MRQHCSDNLSSSADQSGRGLPHSKTLRAVWSLGTARQRPGVRQSPAALGWASPTHRCLAVVAATLVVGLLVSCGSHRPPVVPVGLPALPHTNLLVYHKTDGTVAPVKSKSDWERRRVEILRGMTQVMGPLPGPERWCPFDMTVDAQTNCGTYTRMLISYAADPGPSRVPAYLLIPNSALGGKKQLPAILALHPTDMKYGHRVVVEKMRDYYRAYGHDLAERGYIVIAPAYPLMANYQPDLKVLGYHSGTMKAIRDNIRALDLLETLPFVRKGRYAAIGHSLGGHNAIFTAVFEPRICCVVSSCGFDSFLAYDGGNPASWQPEHGWCQTRYMPRLANYRGHLRDIPFDFYELLAALAPRPVFVNAPTRDDNFRVGSVDNILTAASAIYRLYHVPGVLQAAYPDCAHDFPPDVREAAYAFIDQQMR